MSTRLRRCHLLFLRCEDRLRFDPQELMRGGTGVHWDSGWTALAPHLGAAVELDPAEATALGGIGSVEWAERGELESRVGTAVVESLQRHGLLLADDDSDHARADLRLREGHWHALPALMHAFTRWQGSDTEAARRQARFAAVSELVEACGPPPPASPERVDALRRQALPQPANSALDELMARRATCRNFAVGQPLDQGRLATLLKRVFGATGSETVAPGATVLKKNHPSGGGLHSIEAYALVTRVEGIDPGIYHYNATHHRLDLLRLLGRGEARRLAEVFVAGQDYFAKAQVSLVLTSRFARAHWKYRNHAKIYRAILLEAGHVSQNIYLSATELGLGAYVTAAVNEVDIERELGLDPMDEGVLAICGFGIRGDRRETVEFDPLGKVWPGGTGTGTG
jgi:putative peptide maturation dehydrogenase